MLERKVTLIRDRTHNHQVMSPTRSPLSHPGGARKRAGVEDREFLVEPITRRQILDSSKLTDFADDNFKFDKNGRNLSKRVENTVGKGEIARYEQFPLFLQCFQKVCSPGASKGVIVWEWVNCLPNDKILDWSKLKQLADNKINATRKLKIVLGRAENIVGQGENADYQHFLLFPQCFLLIP